MKLNLGCADWYTPGWVNVDHEAPFHVDEVVDLRGELPWAHGSVTHVFAGHLLEHMPVAEGEALLRRLLPCMVPGGEIVVVGPDVVRAQAMAEAGTLDVTMESLHHGAHRWPGDEHHWDATPGETERMLRDAGWAGVYEIPWTDVPEFWPIADRRPVWQFAVYARRAVDAALT